MILLGFVCQSLSWDGYGMLFLHVLLWVGCLKIQERRPLLVSQPIELALLGLGCVLGYLVGQLPGQSSHFFIGYGVTLLQCARLVRGLNPREKRISVILAMLQIGVACTVVLDYRFILLLLGICILIPRALMEMSVEYFPAGEGGSKRIGWRGSLCVLGIMLGFFLVFPRGLLSGGAGAFRPPGSDSSSLLDSIVDPSRSGDLGSEKPVLQIQGEELGYLKLFALTDFVDGVWKADVSPVMRRISMPDDTKEEDVRYRKVRVKDVRFIGRSLPADGFVVRIEGNFFRRPLQSIHGNVECSEIWNTTKNVYECWVEPTSRHDYLLGRWKRRFLRSPEPTEEVRQWISRRLEGIDDPLGQAKALEAYLKDNFTYDLGAPELERLNALGDFLVRERRGHCERFASALALLLRMQGIPSRVLVGFVPGSPNVMTGWTTVRQRDAHAWTEAFIEGQGWVALDATPRASMDLSLSPWREALDALDAVWYVNIVNMDSTAQQAMMNAGVSLIATIPSALGARPFLLLPLMLLVFLLLLVRFKGKWILLRRVDLADPGDTEKERQVRFAEDFYGRFLKVSALAGFNKRESQTPWEFLDLLRDGNASFVGEAVAITDTVCEIRYGGRMVATEELNRVEEELARIENQQG